jgi:choline dehydrogenase
MWATVADQNTFDYVIVGAGSAGCVLADRLSSSGQHSVLLIEGGGSDKSPFILLPFGLYRMPRKFDWLYKAEPDVSRNGQVDRWAAGKVLGGSSSVNGMMWVRGDPRDFDRWAQEGAEGWSFDDVLPYFRRAETFEDGSDLYRGDDGPQRVARTHVKHVLTDAFIDAADQAGFPRNRDYNGKVQTGGSYAQCSQGRGLRWSTARGYLRRARKRKNFTLWTESYAQKVVVESGRAAGVIVERDGVLTTVRCNKEIVLSAGALSSPRILLSSGIGPAEELKQLGVTPVVDAPGVGKNLQEHPVGTVLVDVNVRTLNQETSSVHALRHALDFVVRGHGGLTGTAAQAVVFGGLQDGAPHTEFEIMFGPFGVAGEVAPDVSDQDATYEHDVHAMKLAKTPTVTILPCVVHPRSRGEVTLAGPNPKQSPKIRHELYGDPRDLDDMVEAVKVVRRILQAPAFAKYVVSEQVPSEAIGTDEQLREIIPAISFRGEHASGTCRMGSDEKSVVDPQLRVRGVRGLRVVDASVMPSLTSGNTNAPVIMIGEKAADLILSSDNV